MNKTGAVPNQLLIMENVPIEIQEKILWYLRGDPVSLHRAENVCSTWAEIIAFFEQYKRLRFRQKRVGRAKHRHDFDLNQSQYFADFAST